MVSTLAETRDFLRGDHQIPIYYEDTDLSGFVYHANYLKFFERAREHLIGVEYLKTLWHSGVHFVVSEANIKYLRPAKHGDLLTIRSEVSYSRSPLLLCKQSAYRETNGKEDLIAQADICLVTLNGKNKPMRLPEFVIENFRKQ